MQGAPPNTGVFGDGRRSAARLVDRLVAALDPQAIWLFGSRARGTHRSDSDTTFFGRKAKWQFGSADYVKALTTNIRFRR